MVLAFVSVLLACFGELAVILCAGVFATVWITLLGLFTGQFPVPLGQWFTVAIYAHVFCLGLLSFSVFFPSLLTPYYYY